MREFTKEDAMRLISRMRGMYGKKFIDQWAGVEIEEIAFAMVDCLNGLSVEELQAGFEKMKASAFCPSVPEFRAWCEAASPYLSENEAWLQAVKYDHKGGSTDISKLAKQAYEMSHIDNNKYIDADKQGFFMFRDCYLRLVAEAKKSGVRDEVVQAPKMIPLSIPRTKSKYPEPSPEEKQKIAELTAKYQAKGLSFPNALLKAHSEFSGLSLGNGGAA